MNSIFVLALIVAVVSRIVTQESIFVELQAWARKQQSHSRFAIRKLTYPLQCQFCFSVWVSGALATYLYFHSPFDLVWLSAADYSPITILATTFTMAGITNGFLIAYELVTVQITRLRQGNHHRALNLEWKRTEYADWKEWRAEHRERLEQHRKARAERSFLEKVAGGTYGYPWNEGRQSAQNEGLEQ